MKSEQLKKIVDDRGIKQAWIARKLKISRAVVNQWVNGTASIPEPRVEELKNLLR